MIRQKAVAKEHRRELARPEVLRLKVEPDLNRKERLGISSRVTTPVPWCVGMVAVSKKSEEVRICVDLKALNKSVPREPYTDAESG